VKWQLNETKLDKNIYNDYRSLKAGMGLEIKVKVEAEDYGKYSNIDRVEYPYTAVTPLSS
jgi:hypothetical protein